MTNINNPKKFPKKGPEIQQKKASGLASLGKLLKVRDKVSDVLKTPVSPTNVPKKSGESDSKTHLVTVTIPESLRGVISIPGSKTPVFRQRGEAKKKEL